MASAVHCQLNPQVRLFVPTAMTSKLAYSTVQHSTAQHRRGKREEGEEPVSKHQIRPGDGRWTGRRGVGRLNPRRESKIQGKNGDREGRKLKKSQKGETFWKILPRKRRRRGRAERRRLQQAKGGIEHVREDGRSQLPRTTSGRWRWMGHTELDGRWTF